MRCQTALRPDGAEKGIRTPNLLITNQLLYQLSHFGYMPSQHRFPIGTSQHYVDTPTCYDHGMDLKSDERHFTTERKAG